MKGKGINKSGDRGFILAMICLIILIILFNIRESIEKEREMCSDGEFMGWKADSDEIFDEKENSKQLIIVCVFCVLQVWSL